jgi:hypothetical protein
MENNFEDKRKELWKNSGIDLSIEGDNLTEFTFKLTELVRADEQERIEKGVSVMLARFCFADRHELLTLIRNKDGK